MNYEEMSDHEINMAVTCIVYNCHDWSVNENNSGFYHCSVDGSCHYIVNCIDFCNNPNDAWPIIINNNISLHYNWKEEHKYTASIYIPMNKELRFHARNFEVTLKKGLELRAAMICFLKMKESIK